MGSMLHLGASLLNQAQPQAGFSTDCDADQDGQSASAKRFGGELGFDQPSQFDKSSPHVDQIQNEGTNNHPHSIDSMKKERAKR